MSTVLNPQQNVQSQQSLQQTTACDLHIHSHFFFFSKYALSPYEPNTQTHCWVSPYPYGVGLYFIVCQFRGLRPAFLKVVSEVKRKRVILGFNLSSHRLLTTWWALRRRGDDQRIPLENKWLSSTGQGLALSG